MSLAIRSRGASPPSPSNTLKLTHSLSDPEDRAGESSTSPASPSLRGLRGRFRGSLGSDKRHTQRGSHKAGSGNPTERKGLGVRKFFSPRHGRDSTGADGERQGGSNPLAATWSPAAAGSSTGRNRVTKSNSFSLAAGDGDNSSEEDWGGPVITGDEVLSSADCHDADHDAVETATMQAELGKAINALQAAHERESALQANLDLATATITQLQVQLAKGNHKVETLLHERNRQRRADAASRRSSDPRMSTTTANCHTNCPGSNSSISSTGHSGGGDGGGGAGNDGGGGRGGGGGGGGGAGVRRQLAAILHEMRALRHESKQSYGGYNAGFVSPISSAVSADLDLASLASPPASPRFAPPQQQQQPAAAAAAAAACAAAAAAAELCAMSERHAAETDALWAALSEARAAAQEASQRALAAAAAWQPQRSGGAAQQGRRGGSSDTPDDAEREREQAAAAAAAAGAGGGPDDISAVDRGDGCQPVQHRERRQQESQEDASASAGDAAVLHAQPAVDQRMSCTEADVPVGAGDAASAEAERCCNADTSPAAAAATQQQQQQQPSSDIPTPAAAAAAGAAAVAPPSPATAAAALELYGRAERAAAALARTLAATELALHGERAARAQREAALHAEVAALQQEAAVAQAQAALLRAALAARAPAAAAAAAAAAGGAAGELGSCRGALDAPGSLSVGGDCGRQAHQRHDTPYAGCEGRRGSGGGRGARGGRGGGGGGDGGREGRGAREDSSGEENFDRSAAAVQQSDFEGGGGQQS
ncbi:hypothetical protein JKP88DRAFT_314550 [Tribonema minus]|uniref:Uncharacterized protein n=1 Tax=Tribonema minus TaxID=303371 RepID=A0A835Z1G5_9STRA|nr:hypothetical protein JKP88DRAFT_314550 [Tribonema minus]